MLQEYFDEVGESLTKTTDQLVERAHQFTHKSLVRGDYIVNTTNQTAGQSNRVLL